MPPSLLWEVCGFLKFPPVVQRNGQCDASVHSFLFGMQPNSWSGLFTVSPAQPRRHLPEAEPDHALASFLHYLLLSNQKSGQEQDFLLTSISLELLRSRSRQGMAKIN